MFVSKWKLSNLFDNHDGSAGQAKLPLFIDHYATTLWNYLIDCVHAVSMVTALMDIIFKHQLTKLHKSAFCHRSRWGSCVQIMFALKHVKIQSQTKSLVLLNALIHCRLFNDSLHGENMSALKSPHYLLNVYYFRSVLTNYLSHVRAQVHCISMATGWVYCKFLVQPDL